MGKFRESFLNALTKRDLKYQEINDEGVRLSFSTDKEPSTIVLFIFFDEGEDVCGVTLQSVLCRFREEKLTKGLVVCNSCNARYRDAKFYIDKDMDVFCTIDSYIDEATGTQEVMANVSSMLNIIEDSYPIFMKALWAD